MRPAMRRAFFAGVALIAGTIAYQADAHAGEAACEQCLWDCTAMYALCFNTGGSYCWPTFEICVNNCGPLCEPE